MIHAMVRSTLARRPGWWALLLVLTFQDLASAQDDVHAIRDELASMAQADPRPERAQEIAGQIVDTWRRIQGLDDAQRGTWQHTLLAVLAAPLAEVEPKESSLDRQRSPRNADPEPPEGAALSAWYQALQDALSGADAAPTEYVRYLLAASLGRELRDLPPERRDELAGRTIELATGVASFAQQADDLVLAALGLHQVAHCHFITSRRNEAEAEQGQLVQIYQQLGDEWLQPASLDLSEALAARVAALAREAYQDEAADYLLCGMARFNAAQDARRQEQPKLAVELERDSMFLYAECLRLGILHEDTTPINNVGALMIRSGIGEETGRAQKIHYLTDLLEVLPDASANVYWRNRDLRQTDQAVRWLHARALAYLGDFYAQAGQVLNARQALRRAEPLAQGLDDEALLPLVLETQTRLLARMNLVDECLESGRRALDAHGSLKQRADVLITMSEACRRAGLFDRADDYLRWAFDLFVKPGSFTLNRSDVPVLSSVREAAARLELARAHPQKALDAMREAADLRSLEDPDEGLGLLLELSRLARALAEPRRYAASAALVKSLGKTPAAPLVALAARRGAGTRVRLEGWRDSPLADTIAGAALVAEQATLLRNLPQPEPAEESGKLLEELHVKSARLLERIGDDGMNAALRARLALDAGQLEDAAREFAAELTLRWTTWASDLDVRLGVETLDYLEQLHHDAALVQVRLGHAPRALAIMDMVRHRGLAQAGQAGSGLWEGLADADRETAFRLDERRTEANQRLRQLMAQVDGTRNETQLVAAREMQGDAEAAWRKFTSQLRDARRLQPLPTEPLTQEQLEALVPQHEALVVYSVGQHETLAVLAAHRDDKVEFSCHELPISRDQLSALVEALRLGCQDPRLPYELLARELYQVLVEPWAEAMRGIQRVAIAPDGPLDNLPFAALIATDGQFLVEKLALSRVTSLLLQQRLAKVRADAGQGALVVDLQHFGDRTWLPASYAAVLGPEVLGQWLSAYRLADLPNVQREGDRVAELLGPAVDRLSGDSAREQAVLKAARGKRFVHFATHGLVDLYDPLLSVLVLASSKKGERSDGFLEASEILDSDSFRGAELVTLSACESGLGLVQGSEGVLGMTWAFLASGSRAVFCSLWSVDDAATADCMEHFYRAVTEHQHKADALRAAQLALLREGPTAHPAYWAPFQIIGDASTR